MSDGEALPDRLQRQLDELDEEMLWTVRAYIDDRLQASQHPLVVEIMTQTPDPSRITVLGETPGGVLLTRREDDDQEYLYRVNHESMPSGEIDLHWNYLGRVHETQSDDNDVSDTSDSQEE